MNKQSLIKQGSAGLDVLQRLKNMQLFKKCATLKKKEEEEDIVIIDE